MNLAAGPAVPEFEEDTSKEGAAEAKFKLLYEENLGRLLGYALRRVDEPGDAADVVAETFLVAWRRFNDVPGGPDATFWLYGVARNVLCNHHRTRMRRSRLAERLRACLAENADPAPISAEAESVRAALERLTPDDRELLSLANWEGLAPSAIAAALGVSPAAARTRLSRARKRMKKELGKRLDNRGDHHE